MAGAMLRLLTVSAILSATVVPTMAQDLSQALKNRTIYSQQGWTELTAQHRDGVLIFRKYAPLTSASDFRNVFNFTCNTPPAHNYLTIKIPNEVKLLPLSERDWETNASLRFLADQAHTFSLAAEYVKGEFFVDRTEQNWREFDKAVKARELTLEFGPLNDRVSFIFAANVDGYLSEALPLMAKAQKLGPVKRLDYAGVLDQCQRFRTKQAKAKR